MRSIASRRAHAARAPQHDTVCEGRHYAWHRHPEERCEASRLEGSPNFCHPEERCEASRLEGRTLRVLLSMTQAAKVGTTHGTVTLRSDAKHRVSKGARCACSSA